MSDAASDRLPRGPERRGAVGRTGAVVDAGRRETTRRTYTRNGNLGSDVSVILKETFDMITGDGRSCATRAILEVPSPPDRPAAQSTCHDPCEVCMYTPRKRFVKRPPRVRV